MKVLILHPRLDLTFKKGPVRGKSSKIPEIRTYWRNFLAQLKEFHLSRKDEVEVLELPLWQFNTIQVLEKKPDLVYVPHKDINRFNCHPVKALYYMQMVFPWVFELDPQGPFSYSTNYPQPIHDIPINELEINKLKDRANAGHSKFDQPSNSVTEIDYVFFIGQMERDESIRLHSKVGVHEALEKTVIYCKDNNLNLLVKPHPFENANLSKQVLNKYNYGKLVNGNINYLLRDCKFAVTVNSGAGMEALLFDKPIVYFGEAEYCTVGHKASIVFSEPSFETDKYLNLYPAFLTSYLKDRVNSNDITSYSILEKFF